VSLGKSVAVLPRVRELQERKAALESQMRIIAEFDGGRLLMPSAAPDVTHGAQEASHGSLSIRARRR
jgi:hypothetical protein